MSSGQEDVVFLRYLQEQVCTDNVPTANATLSSPNDSVIIQSTLRTYGSLYLFLIIIFCFVRSRYPRYYNVRSWAPSVYSQLAAEDHFGAINWFWKVWYISDDDFRQQCGMDALSFTRIYRFGLRVSLVGCFNSLWLVPIYVTSPIVKGANAHIKDIFAMATAGYVPPGSHRFVGTVLAAYIHFGAIMYLLLKEFEWFTTNRHKYLSETEPRNYTVYVSHIPAEFRTSARLLEYFQSCFSPDAVLEAHIALKIPTLEKQFAAREALVNKLEHAINVEEITGKTPTHRLLLSGKAIKVNSIDAYTDDLRGLNNGIRKLIENIELNHGPLSFEEDLEARGVSVRDAGTQNASPKFSSGKSMTAGIVDETSSLTFANGIEKPIYDPELTEIIEQTSFLDGEDTMMVVPETPNTSRSNGILSHVRSSVASKGGHVLSTVKSATGNVAAVGGNVLSGVTNNVAHVGGTVLTGVGNVAAVGLSLIMGSEDGEPRESGFVTFTNLKTTQAALQQIHHETPFVFEVAEAPQPEDIYWSNVGKNHKELQLGKLLSFVLTGVLCLFWTIPVTLISTLTEVDSLKKSIPILQDITEAWPAFELVLAQLAPLVLIGIKALLPMILGYFSAMEGPVSSSVLEASLFYKLAIFEIVQTFFVSAISGSIVSEITNIIEQGTGAAITFLANSIPTQSSFFLQILFVQTFLGQGLELLRVTPLAISFVRSFLGPRLTEKERDTAWFGLRPMADPSEFEFADVVSNGMLYFMVVFIYGTAMAPVTNWFLAICFVIMISGYRHQLVFNYPPTPDSGGQMWISFFNIAQTAMLIGQVTLLGYLSAKQSILATPLMVPLIIITILFNFYVRQRHVLVSQRLPSRAALKRDLQNQENGPMDMSFIKGVYQQPALQSKEDVFPENYGVAREIAQDQIAFMTPPGSEADIGEADGAWAQYQASLETSGSPRKSFT